MKHGMQPAAVQSIPPKVTLPTGPLPPSTVSQPSRMTDEELIEAVAQRVVDKLAAREVHVVYDAPPQPTADEIVAEFERFRKHLKRLKRGWVSWA